jgi:hypothetical protein
MLDDFNFSKRRITRGKINWFAVGVSIVFTILFIPVVRFLVQIVSNFVTLIFLASIFALLPPLIGSSIAGWDATESLDLTPFVLGVVYPLIYAAFIAVDVQREGTLQILFASLFVVIIFEVVVAYFMYLALRVMKSRIADS